MRPFGGFAASHFVNPARLSRTQVVGHSVRRCARAHFNGIWIHCEASRPELVRKLLLDLVWRHGASRFWALEQLLIKPHLGRGGDKAQAKPGKQDSGYSMSSQRFIQSRILRRCKASSEHWGALLIRKGLNE